MPIQLPEGFLTRPEAAKLFNRSQRALERELDPALLMRDEKVLIHWKLVTKEGQVREATDVTTDMVKQLVANGMTPTWCVEGKWLEEKYGRKGEERPRATAEHVLPNHSAPSAQQHSAATKAAGVDKDNTTPIAYVQKENEFLKERIRILETEKREEIERNEKREAKLFEQLEVKDKQISAWDEITQGITKALATGQLAPSLTAGIRKENEDRREEEGTDVIEVDPAADATEQGTSRRTPPAAPQKSTGASKRKQKQGGKSPASEKKKPEKVEFFSTGLPTFAKLFRRKKNR